MQYLGHTFTKILFSACLNFKFNWHPLFYLATLTMCPALCQDFGTPEDRPRGIQVAWRNKMDTGQKTDMDKGHSQIQICLVEG